MAISQKIYTSPHCSIEGKGIEKAKIGGIRKIVVGACVPPPPGFTPLIPVHVTHSTHMLL